MEIDGINHDMPTPGRFGEYIRKNSLSSAGDPAIDAWGMPYRLDAPPKKLAIRSAGPDKTFETGDDIVVEVQGMTTR